MYNVIDEMSHKPRSLQPSSTRIIASVVGRTTEVSEEFVVVMFKMFQDDCVDCPEGGYNKLSRNVGIHLPVCTVSDCRRLECLSAPS